MWVKKKRTSQTKVKFSPVNGRWQVYHFYSLPGKMVWADTKNRRGLFSESEEWSYPLSADQGKWPLQLKHNIVTSDFILWNKYK